MSCTSEQASLMRQLISLLSVAADNEVLIAAKSGGHGSISVAQLIMRTLKLCKLYAGVLQGGRWPSMVWSASNFHK